jgi:glycine/D-amino acid oxidase-like deaminating enzyme
MTRQKFISDHNAMPRTADIVIIGGGPVGTAILWAIERFAPGTHAVLIEKSNRLGAGSSIASLENFRTCWSALCLTRQMLRGVEVFLNADEYLGEGASQSLAIKQPGYLFCALNTEHAAALKNDVKRLHEIGLRHVEYLDAEEVRYRFGWLGERVIAAKFDPTAGWLDSNALIYRYAQNTDSAQIILGAQDAQICVEDGRVTGVETPYGHIATPQAVIAAGAGSRAVGRTAGIELPIILRPRQSFTTGSRHSEFPEDAPMIIGAPPYPHVRPEAREGAIFGWEYNWRNKELQSNYGTNASHDAIIDAIYPTEQLKDPRFPSITLALLARQLGHADGHGFADSRYLRGISHNIGYYVYRDETVAYKQKDEGVKLPYDSERAIIDAHPDIEGLFMSVAHVGHGIMGSPAAGEIMACKLLGMPLPDPIFHEFGLDVPWVEYDENAL